MTSIGSFAKQIPLNNGYFRPIPAIAAALNATANVGSVSSYMYTINATTGAFPAPFTPQGASTAAYLSLGTCLLRDMGTQILSTGVLGNSSPVVFRRVQIVDTSPGAGLNTDGVGGQYNNADSDYNCAYILMGFNGAAPAGPFVRTG